MRAFLPAYDMRTPRSLTAALKLLREEAGQWQPFAGGTDLMVLFEAGSLPPGKFLNLWQLDELRERVVDNHFVTLGALTTYTQVLADPILAKEFPNLTAAARATGAVAIQNRGTLGGNIANASPAADSPPALLVYDAQLELVSAHETRWVPYAEFHLGYKKTVLRDDELISRVRLPRATKGRHHYYRKVGTREAQAISKVCLAGVIRVGKTGVSEVKIAVGSVAPTVLRCHKTENWLKGKTLTPQLIAEARMLLVQEIAPIDDIRSTGTYRRAISGALLTEFLERVAM